MLTLSCFEVDKCSRKIFQKTEKSLCHGTDTSSSYSESQSRVAAEVKHLYVTFETLNKYDPTWGKNNLLEVIQMLEEQHEQIRMFLRVGTFCIRSRKIVSGRNY